MKKIFNYIFIYTILIMIFVFCLVIVSCIPRKKIYNKTEKSLEILQAEKEYYSKDFIFKTILYDNYADAIMINNAYSMDDNTPLYSALIIRRNFIPGETEITLPDESGDPSITSSFEIDNLKCVIQDIPIISKEYAKYWHGYLVTLKPLLIILDYEQIRILQLIIISMLMFGLIYLIYKKIGIIEAIIFLFGLVIVDIQYIYASLEYTQVFILMLVSSIVLLVKYKKIRDIGKLFFIIGMITCFIDFLTAPIITLGIPIMLYILLKQKEKKLSMKEQIIIIIKNSIIWLLGYSITWITKFMLVDILYNKDLIHTALKQIGHRTFDGTSTIEISFAKLFNYNFKNCNIAIFVIFVIAQILFRILDKNDDKKIYIKEVVPYLIISCMPIVWYLVLQEHSIRHAFFTYRALSVFWIGIMLTINYINFRGNNVKNK